MPRARPAARGPPATRPATRRQGRHVQPRSPSPPQPPVAKRARRVVPPVSGNDSILSTGGVQQILPIVPETMTVMTDGPELDTISTSLVSCIEQTVKTAMQKVIQTHPRGIMGQEPILSSAIQSQN
jgi:hypothetical protein